LATGHKKNDSHTAWSQTVTGGLKRFMQYACATSAGLAPASRSAHLSTNNRSTAHAVAPLDVVVEAQKRLDV